MFDWDDLKPFLAVARCGSTMAAARALRVDQSTVQRRVAELERRVGQALVERRPSGYRLTAYGEELRPLAEAVEQQVALLEHRIRATSRELNGIVRLTCPEPLVRRIMQSPLLDHLHAVHPRLSIEFVTSDRYLDLAKGEADVALRSGDTVDGSLVGRKVADSLWAVYASRAYAQKAPGTPACLAEASVHPWITLDASMEGHRSRTWLHDALPSATVVATSTSVLGLVHSVKAGLGIAALPTALGDAETDLVRLFGPVPELTRIWRILTTAALRKTPRIDAFFRFISAETETLRPILTG
jgi:DNA-binding transcriptional LysR family regulator